SSSTSHAPISSSATSAPWDARSSRRASTSAADHGQGRRRADLRAELATPPAATAPEAWPPAADQGPPRCPGWRVDLAAAMVATYQVGPRWGRDDRHPLVTSGQQR